MTHTLYSVGIITHPHRQHMADTLADTMSEHASVEMFTDTQNFGARKNAQTAWEWMASNTNTEWVLMLEDDAIPVDSIGTQLRCALPVAPTQAVSFYTGTGYPEVWQPVIREALDSAPDTTWFTAHGLCHGVALAIHRDIIGPMTHRLAGWPSVPIDQAIDTWVRYQARQPIAHSRPSLFDHADTEPLATHTWTKRLPRKAWRHGTRTVWDTTSYHIGQPSR